MDDNAPSDFKFSKKRFEFSPAPATTYYLMKYNQLLLKQIYLFDEKPLLSVVLIDRMQT